ncbi:MAG: hypothetical protein M1828_003128 [Chrysothrix sp. TS-e1954]|nr:MAG: hypothetical protein M1828_003128 [Chrysothrix sp. TS-e1954]
MKASPLLVSWHNDSAPIYSAHFEPHGRGRLATAGQDNNVRLWKVEPNGEERKITYLSTLTRHTQAVNVVRWCPRGELLASAGDDGNVLLWTPTDHLLKPMGDDGLEDLETWHVKRMRRQNTASEIYDLAWSPDGTFFVTGSMDNVARIFDAGTGNIVRQIAEHNHYVQGVAWDPLNEYLATQSSDRSVHIYALKTTDGQFSLSHHGRTAKMDLPPRSRKSDSPAPADQGNRIRLTSDASSQVAGSPAPSAPGTPASLPLPMNPPPPTSQSRRSSFGNGSPRSVRRSASPAPSMPLPAVMPSASPRPSSLGIKNTNIYANEQLTSFFRRLTFAPDGSLLFTPAGQYKTSNASSTDKVKGQDDVINTVYIYGRAGLNKPPMAHLPGHKKPSIAVRCSPIYYNLRLPAPTKQISIDTSTKDGDITPLPEPAMPAKRTQSVSSMDPPPIAGTLSPSPSTRAASPKIPDRDQSTPPAGPPPAFALPYRIVYAVATQDAVYIYDTQQSTPLCVVSNLHFATFTDVTWSMDGHTLLMSSSDGFCSALSFSPGELGSVYHGSLASRLSQGHRLSDINTTSSTQSTPNPTPTGIAAPPVPKQPSSAGFAPSPSPITAVRPPSPTRSNSASSSAAATSHSQSQKVDKEVIISNPTPSFGNVPSLAAAQSGVVPGVVPLTSPTPPMTPGTEQNSIEGKSFTVPSKRPESESEKEDGKREVKRRRVQPTLVAPEGKSTDK